MLVVLTVVWGTNWPLFPLALQEISVWTFRSITAPTSGLILLAVARLRGLPMRIPREHWPTIAAASFFYLVVWNICSTYSALMIPSGQSAVLGYTMPLWSALLSWAVLGQRLNGRLLVALALPWSRPSPEVREHALSVRLLQGNVPQDAKFASRQDWALAWYGQALTGTEQGLVVTPETALPYVQQQLPAGYWETLTTHFSQGDRAAMIGLPLHDLGVSTNSVLGLTGPVPPYRYDKHHLVPFGEFIPPLFQWFTRMMNITLGEFGRGRVDAPSMGWQGQRLAPMICYEDLFGEELAQRFRDPAQAPTVWVNLSNIAWFGDTVAVDQHLQISRLRALEFDRPVIRATNTGATAIIDAQGRVTHRLPAHTEGVLQGEVMGRQGPPTPYVRWVSEWGLAPLWVLAVALLWLPGRIRRRAP
jgi:apolipoprotein N-acyltransferase